MDFPLYVAFPFMLLISFFVFNFCQFDQPAYWQVYLLFYPGNYRGTQSGNVFFFILKRINYNFSYLLKFYFSTCDGSQICTCQDKNLVFQNSVQAFFHPYVFQFSTVSYQAQKNIGTKYTLRRVRGVFCMALESLKIQFSVWPKIELKF